jgi:transposase-like protein
MTRQRAMRNYGITQIGSSARIVMICPYCGQENSEFAETLRGMRFYACSGEGCGYSFNLTGRGKRVGATLAEACRKFYAAFYAMRGQGAR